MALMVVDTGDALMLNRALNKSSPADLKLHLFTNNHAPAKGDTPSAYTEATDGSYAIVTLTGASWTTVTSNHVTTSSFPTQTFTFAAAATVYGYYVTDSAGTTLVFAELFSSPLTVPSGGGTISVTLNITGN